jgi:hypothetical protein
VTGWRSDGTTIASGEHKMTDKPFLYYSQRMARTRGVVPQLTTTFLRAFVSFVDRLRADDSLYWWATQEAIEQRQIEDHLEVPYVNLAAFAQGYGVAPEDELVLDYVEFFHRHMEPWSGYANGDEHAREEARRQYREWVNTGFVRANQPLLMNEQGEVQPHPSPVLDDVVWGTDLPTEDTKLRELLLDAQRHFYDRKAGSARYRAALVPLMNALERLKTALGDGPKPDKKKAVGKLLDVLSGEDANLRERLDAYMRALTDLSNATTRHAEHGTSDLDDELSDFLFYSTYTFIRTVLRRLKAEGLVKLDDASEGDFEE